MPRRPHRRGVGRRRLERARLRPLPQRQRCAHQPDRAGAPAGQRPGRHRGGAGAVRGGGLRGRRLRRPAGPHRRPARAAEIQRRAALPRRGAGERAGHGHDLPHGARLSRRADRARRARRPRPPPRRLEGDLRDDGPQFLHAGAPRRGRESAGGQAVTAGALAGVTVLDFSTLLPGPMATLFLAEACAEVINVERAGRGEEMRSYIPRWGKDSADFAMLNRGKKSIALDLKDEAERARLRPLIERADIVVEQFRPGVMARLGLGYDDIRAIKPDIVYCSITGYGQSGPGAARAGHDLNYIGDTGLLALSCGTADTPRSEEHTS